MGAKDWLLVYADGEIQPVPQSVPVLDRQASATTMIPTWNRSHWQASRYSHPQ